MLGWRSLGQRSLAIQAAALTHNPATHRSGVAHSGGASRNTWSGCSRHVGVGVASASKQGGTWGPHQQSAHDAELAGTGRHVGAAAVWLPG